MRYAQICPCTCVHKHTCITNLGGQNPLSRKFVWHMPNTSNKIKAVLNDAELLNYHGLKNCTVYQCDYL